MNTATRLWISLLAASAASAMAQPPPGPPARTIEVTGNAEIHVAPDEVRLWLGVENFSASPAEAMRTNAATCGRVLAAARELKVEPRDIQTDRIALELVYDTSQPQPAREKVVGSIARQRIAITLRDVQQFEALLTAALEAGANQIEGVEYATSRLRELRDKARQDAIVAAREKAEALAAGAGQLVGRPLLIAEDGGFMPYMAQNSIRAEIGGSEGTTVALGQITVRAGVRVTYELRDRE